MARLAMNLNGFTGKPEKNSRHLAVPPLVPRRNDVWESSAEIPYWWRITFQIWAVLLIGWSKFLTPHDQSKAHWISALHFAEKAGTSGVVAKCWLFALATFRSTAWLFWTWTLNSSSQWSFCFVFSCSTKNLQDCPVLWNFERFVVFVALFIEANHY